MLQSVEGIYRNGKVELVEQPSGVSEAQVIVTFLPARKAAPMLPEFSPAELAELRGKFASWEEDWNALGMEAYDEP